ncbi:hypothetical protein [Synechococcus phage S-B68]|nr:hypothetical protein [Synechococcus phage S-B68]
MSKTFDVILEHKVTGEQMKIVVQQASAYDAHQVVRDLYPEHTARSILYTRLY